MSSISQPSTSSQSCAQARSRTSLSDQSQMDTLALKAKYMDILDEINAVDSGSSVRQSVTQISKVVEKADSLFRSVKDTSEMYLDAKVMHCTSSALETASNNVDVGEGNFKLLTFADQFMLKATTGGAATPWESLLSVAQPVVCNSIPHWSPLLGSFEFTSMVSVSPKKKARQARPRDGEAAKKEPEKIIHMTKTEKRAEEIVQMIFKKLKKYYRHSNQKPINYFRFVLNPNSFAATVENIFYVSFLVNDGHVKLEIEDDELFISPNTEGKENSNPQSQQQQSSEKKQNIVSIDMKTWRDLLLVLSIDQPMI